MTGWRADRLGLPAPVGLAPGAARCGLGARPRPGTAPALALVGETLDRASFYATLEPASPARQMMAEALEPSKAFETSLDPPPVPE